jgi:DNA-binding NarL/FixJ family response regulator
MRTILIEDNPQIRELIKSLLATHCPGVSVVGEAESIEAGRLLLSSVPADLTQYVARTIIRHKHK